MNLSEDDVVLAVKPLYGILESVLIWIITYQYHYKTENGIKQKADQCVLYRRYKNMSEGLTLLQEDDSFGFESKGFLKDEDSFSIHFKTKPQMILSRGEHATFNGSQNFNENDGSYSMHQKEKLGELKHVFTVEEFSSVRATIQYIVS